MRDPVFTVVMAIILALLVVVGLAMITFKPDQERSKVSAAFVRGFQRGLSTPFNPSKK